MIVKPKVGFRDALRVDQAITTYALRMIRHHVGHTRDINDPIQDDVRDVYPFGSQLLGHTLSDGAQPVLAGCECSEVGARLFALVSALVLS